jgi:S-(hydroxymethyl)glutathione dehydrogenase/alcohol dehydrogenase
MYSMAGLAEYAVVPVTALARVPDSLPLEEAAVLGCAAFTAFGAVANSGLQPGETVAVVATGGGSGRASSGWPRTSARPRSSRST